MASVRWTPDLTIGEVAGQGPDVFGRVTGVTLHRDGRIIVVDGTAGAIQVFEADGRFAFSIGRPGAGPGEFGGPCCPAIDADGRLWIRDGGNARYQAFTLSDSTAALDTIARMYHGDVNRWAPITFDSRNRLIDIGTRGTPQTGPQLYRMHLGAAGEVEHEVAVHQAPDDSTGVHKVPFQRGDVTGLAYLHPPFGPRELLAHGHDGTYAWALSSRPVVTWFTQDGGVLREIRNLPSSGPALDARDGEAAEEWIQRDMRRTGLSRGQIPFEVPTRHPPLRGLLFDTTGRLWIEIATPRDGDRVAYVFDRGGNRVRVVGWPRDVDLQNGIVKDSVALGVSTDSLGVQRVVRLRPQ